MKKEVLKKYEMLLKQHPGLGVSIAEGLKHFDKEDLFDGFDYASQIDDIGMKNCFIMAIAYKKNS